MHRCRRINVAGWCCFCVETLTSGLRLAFCVCRSVILGHAGRGFVNDMVKCCASFMQVVGRVSYPDTQKLRRAVVVRQTGGATRTHRALGPRIPCPSETLHLPIARNCPFSSRILHFHITLLLLLLPLSRRQRHEDIKATRAHLPQRTNHNPGTGILQIVPVAVDHGILQKR